MQSFIECRLPPPAAWILQRFGFEGFGSTVSNVHRPPWQVSDPAVPWQVEPPGQAGPPGLQ
jgi:hypothetical protein